MPMPRLVTQPKSCLNCGVTFERRLGEARRIWDARRFHSQKCNGEWHARHKAGIFSDEAEKHRLESYSDERRAASRERMLGNTFAKGNKLTDEHKSKLVKSGDDHANWKGVEASYSAFHKWLLKHHGKPSRCESVACPNLPSFRFEYALIAGKEHAHNRDNYRMLCVPCHRSYDSRDNKLNVRF